MKNIKSILILCTFLLIYIAPLNIANANIFTNILKTQSYTFSGKVTNSKMEPIDGAKITIELDGGLFGSATGTTDQIGNYAFSITKTNTWYWLTINKQGYKTYRNKVWIGAGGSFNITIEPDKYPISGKIIDNNGDPIEGAKIMFELEGGLSGVQEATTDQLGNYSTGVSTKNQWYWVTIIKDGYKTSRTKYWTGDINNFNYTLRE
jgi:uncharacterized GH25 family protein